MVYMVQMFGRSSNPVAHHVGSEFVAALKKRDATIVEVGGSHGGVGWVGFDVTSRRSGGPFAAISVEVNTRRDVLALSLGSDAAKAQGERLDGVNVKIELLLSGEPTDWQTVGVMWSVASQMWSAVAWDEGSGFDVRLDELTV